MKRRSSPGVKVWEIVRKLGVAEATFTFNVLEDFNREALRIEIDTNLPARRVVRALDELVELRAHPRCCASTSWNGSAEQ